MKSKLKLYMVPLLLAAMFIFATVVPEDLFARGGFRGGGRSFGGGRASSWGKSSRQRSSWGGSKSRSMQSRRGAGGRKMSKRDRTLYNKAKVNGTVFKSRASAKKSFQKNYGSQYGSKYGSKPNQRPNHIPATTKVSGKSTPVSYDQSRGGYGYYGASGRWMMYSVMADVAMMSMLMNRHNYYHGPGPMQRGGYGGGSWSGIFVVFIIIFLAISFRSRF